MREPLSTDRLEAAHELLEPDAVPEHARDIIRDLLLEIERLRHVADFPVGPLPAELAPLLAELAQNPSDASYAPAVEGVLSDIAALFAPTQTTTEWGVRFSNDGICSEEVHPLPAEQAQQLAKRTDVADLGLVHREVRTIAGPWQQATDG